MFGCDGFTHKSQFRVKLSANAHRLASTKDNDTFSYQSQFDGVFFSAGYSPGHIPTMDLLRKIINK